MFRQQPYKAVDKKFYTVKYPSSSIHKPMYRTCWYQHLEVIMLKLEQTFL